MDEFSWLGLSKTQAAWQAAQLGLDCVFLETRDPRQKEAPVVAKVVQVKETQAQLHLRLAYFAQGIESE